MNHRNIILSTLIALCSGYPPATLAMLSKEASPEKCMEQLKQRQAELAPNLLRYSFFQACNEGNTTEVARCINKVDVNAALNGVTPLYVACMKGYLEIVKLLIMNGADIKASSGIDSPFSSACQMGYFEIVKYLVENGADIHEKNTTFLQNTPLHFACQARAHKLAQMVGTNKAVASDHYKIVEFLLQHGAKVDALNSCNMTPLHTTCCVLFNESPEIVTLLLSFGAKVKTLDNDECTPLHLACITGGLETVKLLIKHDPSLINDIQINGATPLHAAVKGGCVPIVRACK